jgi:hypothetical protein
MYVYLFIYRCICMYIYRCICIHIFLSIYMYRWWLMYVYIYYKQYIYHSLNIHQSNIVYKLSISLVNENYKYSDFKSKIFSFFADVKVLSNTPFDLIIGLNTIKEYNYNLSIETKINQNNVYVHMYHI